MHYIKMKFSIETFGCRMNICDSEIIVTILRDAGHDYVRDSSIADAVILNSCSVREEGHDAIRKRLASFDKDAKRRKILILAGCYASLLNDSAFCLYPTLDIIVNSNNYKALPSLLNRIYAGERHLADLSKNSEEVYDDCFPTRVIEDQTTAAVTVMKGCGQYCSYCIEPYTRGKEKCRSAKSIINESMDAARNGFREITLVGHIIDKYYWKEPDSGRNVNFAELLAMIADNCPMQRIKFLSSHPGTFSDEILDCMASYSNIMKVVHLPVQSGSDDILSKMNRGYSADEFVTLVEKVRERIPEISIITDIMVGFCSETDTDFLKTVNLIKYVNPFDINIYRFSMRQGTSAYRDYSDDVSESVKMERYEIMRSLKNDIRNSYFEKQIGTNVNLITEGTNNGYYYGRDNCHRMVLFEGNESVKINNDVTVRVEGYNANGLIGRMV